MSSHRKKGATLGLIPVLLLVMILIGMATFIFTELFGGNRQLINATDAGALATARNLLAVGLMPTEVSQLPPEFQALGVDNSGAPTGVDGSTGLAANNSIFNVYAFNRAAGLTLLIALNAAEDGSPSAISNANTLINALNTFGTNLNADLANDPSFANTFIDLSSSNQTTMLGTSNIELGNNEKVQFASIPSEGKANIYFNSAMYSGDPLLTNWVNQLIVNSGTLSTVNSRYNTSDPNAQSGQPFVKGYQALDMTAVTGVNGFDPVVYATAVNPQKLPHMIDQTRFNNSGVSNSCYAPNNAVKAQGEVTEGHTNLVCTALACAMLGASDNQYPVCMPYGWVRIKNNPDALTANSTQAPPLVSVPYWVNGQNSIFNSELWLGAGGYGGIDMANNGVFCTEAYDNPINPIDLGPPGYSGYSELAGWVTYNNSTTSDPTYKDALGHDSRLDPSKQQGDGSYILGYPSPTGSLRFSSNYSQQAILSNMYGVTSIVAYCNSDMYVEGSTPTICQDPNLSMWVSNFNGPNGVNVGPYDNGSQSNGGLSNLEYLKGEVLGAYYDFVLATWLQQPTSTSFTLNTPQKPSGSKVYDRSSAIAYAVPSNYHSVAFGTVATPADLLNQLYNWNASCANVNDDGQWSDLSTPLGKLLQRCKQILPTVTEQQVTALLRTYTLNLNQYQYIYLPPGGQNLIISQTPPAFLKPYPEFATPGATIPDGTAVLTCQDSAWSDAGTVSRTEGAIPVGISGNAVNTVMGAGGSTFGDGGTHASPYMSFTGNLNTYDAVNWTSNSGRNYFLGELSFGNYVNGTYGTYLVPN
jgi:hypothetical protein